LLQDGTEPRFVYGRMPIGANETVVAGVQAGKPVVTLSPGLAPAEELVCHELLHLQVKGVSGYHSLQVYGRLHRLLATMYRDPRVVVAKFHSIIEHSYIFPAMIGKGFSPSRYLLEQLEAVIDRYPHSCYQADFGVHVAMDAWHIMLGSPDSAIDSQRYLAYFERNHSAEYEKAEAICGLCASRPDPEDQPKLFSEALGVLTDISNIGFDLQGTTVSYR